MRKILYLFIIGLLLSMFTVENAIAQTKIDSLQAALKKPVADTIKIKTLNSLASEYTVAADFAKAMDFGKQALELANKINYKLGIAFANKYLGNACFKTGDYDKCREYQLVALSYFEQLKNKKEIANVYSNLGNIYSSQGNLPVATDYYYKGMKIREEIGDKSGLAISYSTLGIVQLNQGAKYYNQALEYFNKSLKIREALGQKKALPNNYFYIGNIYLELGLDSAKVEYYQKARPYLEKGLQISIDLNDKKNMARFYQQLGADISGLCQNGILDDKSKINEYYQKSLKINTEINDKLGMANIYNAMASYVIDKNPKLAIDYSLKASKIATQINDITTQIECAKIVGNAYEKLKNYEQAFISLKTKVKLSDSLKNKDNSQKLTQQAMKYDFDKKQREQELEQQKKDALQDAELKRQKVITFFVVIALALMGVLAIVIFRSYKTKQRDNKILSEQKEEILTQRDEIQKQKDIAEGQRDQIGKQKQQITDSILYAKRIQNVLLPPDDLISEFLPAHFILFKPRDIVSGDFYWAVKKDEKVIITAADCTGHGVPGAFMSMLGMSFLNEIVNNQPWESAGEILTLLRADVKRNLRQTGKEGEAQDGMDIALCIFDFGQMKLQYAGAYNPCYVVRKNNGVPIPEDYEKIEEGDNVLINIRADRMPIGIYLKEKKSFSNNELQIQKDDKVYIFSDGYADQSGGNDKRKLMSRNFQKLLLSICDQPFEEQRLSLDKAHNDWRGKLEQVDDILVIGIKV